MYKEKEAKEALPVRMVKGVIAAGASTLICVGFGLMVLAIPKQPPSAKK